MSEEEKDDRVYWAEKFGVPVDHVIWGQVGNCYGRVVVNNKESAEKISKQVRESGATANGGFLHGMRLGNINSYTDSKGRKVWDITH